MPDQPGYPALVFHISPIYNLFRYLYTLTGKALDRQSTPFVPALQEMMLLKSYSSGLGLWGYFEEAFAASQKVKELKENLATACQHLQTTLLNLATEAMPEFKAEWQRRRAHLIRCRDELAAAWYPKEAMLMQAIEAAFATPWEGPEAERIDVHLLYGDGRAARSRPLSLSANSQPLDILLCDIVHELLHRNTFGSAKDGLWAKLRLYYFAEGISLSLGNEITHAVITWAACTISAQVWDLDFQQVYHSSYEGTINPRASSLDVMADLWPAYQAGELKTVEFIRRAVDGIRVTAGWAPTGKEAN